LADSMPDFVETEADWLDVIHERIHTVFLGQLVHDGRFCELRADGGGKRPVGIWGWNTWCGIHDMTPLVGRSVHVVMERTVDEGLSRPEPGTGLLPHAVPIDEDGRIGYRDGREDVHYRTYDGVHGEDYCLDNIICWAKMALELFLYTRDRDWFTLGRLEAVERSTDFILDNFRSQYNGSLIESGIEGDWTENTDWHADNSNNNACMVQCLDQLVEVESILGRDGRAKRYQGAADEIRTNFRRDASEGGFWWRGGWFLHGNDGSAQRIYGDRYFESTANYFSILWGISTEEQIRRIWSYVNAHPEIEAPLPVLTNHLPRTDARRMNYGRTVTNGDVWLTLGAHATVARLKSGFTSRATQMYKSIMDYERTEGTIHNSIYMDGTRNEIWSPEIGNYGSIITPLVEGVLGLAPRARGLFISPRALKGMRHLRMVKPLSFAGKSLYLDVQWKGGSRLEVVVNGKVQKPHGSSYLLPPDFDDGSKIRMVFH